MALRDDLLPRIGTGTVIAAFFGVLVPLLLVVGTFAFHGVGATTTPALYVAKDYIYAAVIGVGVFVIVFLRARATLSDIGFRRCHIDWLVRGVLIGLILYAFYIATEKTIALRLNQIEPRTSDGIFFMGDSPAHLAVALAFVILVVTPIVTEIFLRGILFGWMRRNLEFGVSAAASSIIFGALHIEIAKYVGVIIFGMTAAWLYERSSSLWAPIAFHVTVNGCYVLQLIAGGSRLP